MYKKIYEFFTSTQNACEAEALTFNNAHRIKLICENTQKFVQKKSIKNLQRTDLQWHALFVESQKRAFAEIDKVDLNLELNNIIYEKTLKNWLQYIYKIIPNAKESLPQYSQRIANNNSNYLDKFNEFKRVSVLDIQSFERALKKIKLLIETTQWETIDSNSKKLAIDDREIVIPHYAFQIYELCTNKSNRPVQLLEQIQEILKIMPQSPTILLDNFHKCSEDSSEENCSHGL